MKDNHIQNQFNKLKNESEDIHLSENHLSNFENKLNQGSVKQGKKTWLLVYKVAAILVLGLIAWPVFNGASNYQHPDFKKYQETKSYFTTYVEYEIGVNKEKINEKNKALILSSLKQVEILQQAYVQLEQDFINLEYDKRILKRMIDNFRKQLDILENIDLLLESSKPNTITDENII